MLLLLLVIKCNSQISYRIPNNRLTEEYTKNNRSPTIMRKFLFTTEHSPLFASRIYIYFGGRFVPRETKHSENGFVYDHIYCDRIRWQDETLRASLHQRRDVVCARKQFLNGLISVSLIAKKPSINCGVLASQTEKTYGIMLYVYRHISWSIACVVCRVRWMIIARCGFIVVAIDHIDVRQLTKERIAVYLTTQPMQ